MPDYLVSLGRTAGVQSNGAVSNIACTAHSIGLMRRELRSGDYDVVHLHEPIAPTICWDALLSVPAPLVGTFHTYSENAFSHSIAALLGSRRRMNRLAQRVAVSEAAAWTGRRFHGGHYRVIPNGVDVAPLDARPVRAPGAPLRIAFVGQAVERKGLPILLRAFEALRDHVPAELQIVGARVEDVAMLLEDLTGIEALGQVDDARKLQVLRDADVLCAPSLGGESFGMVLTEAFAAGTPVVASDIPGYRDVVTDGVDGLLIPRGDATALAETLRDLAVDPAREHALGAAAGRSAQRFAWPTVAEQLLETYEDAIAVPQPERRAGPLRRPPRVRARRRLPARAPAPDAAAWSLRRPVRAAAG